MHEGPRHILFATGPLLDATIAREVVKKCDQKAIDAFLDRIRAMGFRPEVVITDGSALYRESLVERWADVEHQLCVFHVLAEINRDAAQGGAALARRAPEAEAVPPRKTVQAGPPAEARRPEEVRDGASIPGSSEVSVIALSLHALHGSGSRSASPERSAGACAACCRGR